jgi:hypothetical protein
MLSLSPFHSTLQLVWSDLVFDKASLKQDTQKKYLNSKTVLVCPSAHRPGLMRGKGVQHSSHGFRSPKSSGSCLSSTRNWKTLKCLLQSDNVSKKCTCHCKYQVPSWTRYKTLTANYRLQAYVVTKQGEFTGVSFAFRVHTEFEAAS